MKPASLERGLGSLVVVEIANHQVRRPVHDFADLARANVAQPVVHDACLDIENGAAARARLTKLIFRTEHGRQRRNLGLPVKVPELHIGHPLGHFAHYFNGHDRGAVIAFLQARQIRRLKERRAQQ